jgi:hypothetical protein
MQARLDAECYLQHEVRVIKIPIAVPYAIDSREFVRINGTFEHQGTFYRLIKQKLSQDTLTILCIRDDGNRKIHEVIEDVAYTFADQWHSNSSTPKPLQSLMKEYITTSTLLRTCTSGWVMVLPLQTYSEILVPSFTSSIKRPPRVFC